MHRNYLFIIIILGASLAAYLVLMYGVNPAREKLLENQIIKPNESLTMSKELQWGQKAQLVIHYPIFGIPLNAKVTDPSGVTIVDVNSTSYDRELYSEFQTSSDGKYTLTVTNYGTQETPLHIILDDVEKSSSNPFK